MAGTTKVRDRMTVPDTEDEGPQILALVTDKDRGEPEMREVFTLDGKVWRMRAIAPVNVSLRYLHLARTRGWALARDYMLEALLEPGAYEALMMFQDLTAEHLDQVVDAASAVMVGRVEVPN